MTEQQPEFQYQVGGSLPTQSLSYVWRQADNTLYNAVCRGEFCYILTARQMGKSSLSIKTMARLEQAGIGCGVLDMTMIGTRGLTPTQWYASIIRRLIKVFELPIKFRTWWTEHKEHNMLSPVQCLSEFLEQELLEHIQGPVVIFIDEIDALLQLEFSTDDFFALIRACYNHRAKAPTYRRLTFVLIGVVIPSDLIANAIATPFNIGRSIVLSGLDRSEAKPLAAGFTGLTTEPETILETVLYWTGGQPFLTQKVCQLVLEEMGRRQAAGGFSAGDVEAVIRAQVIANWEVNDRPEHLKTIRDRILYNPTVTPRALGLYQQVLAGEQILADESLVQVTLRLSGLVVNDREGSLSIANPIYRAVFDQDWVTKELSELRPYGVEIDAWLASDCRDDKALLRGWKLREALDWAEDTRLGDIDYRFLAASQDAEKQAVESDLRTEIQEREQAEFALQVATEATELLANTQQQAREQFVGLGAFWKLWVGVVLGVACTVGLGRWSGGLQNLELGLLDQFFRWRPVVANGTDSRVVVITIDEPDIQTVGQFPIPDGTLAKALMGLKQANPRLIGLDMYRDLPVEPGHDQLLDVFKTTPNLIGIEKVTGTPIAAPTALSENDRVGFSAQIFDNDGSVRRALLSIEPEPGTVLFSFPAKLVLAYLEQEGIAINEVSRPANTVHLGKAILQPLSPYEGSYIQADASGYQVMLNYVGVRSQFPTFSLTQVLNGEVPEEVIRDRIVLIGSVASTVNNVLITPYTTRETGSMAGVMVHANTISMLLRSALDGRPLLQSWQEWQEIAWILVWTTVGGVVGIYWREKPLRLSLLVITLLAGLASGTYGGFLLGWLMPMIPAGMGLVMAAILVPVATHQQIERAILHRTICRLWAATEEAPAVGQIALAYLKRFEKEKNQVWIEEILVKVKETEKSSENKSR